jgi:tripartite-type tricarboxylate transporter receptor subunit TctC
LCFVIGFLRNGATRPRRGGGRGKDLRHLGRADTRRLGFGGQRDFRAVRAVSARTIQFKAVQLARVKSPVRLDEKWDVDYCSPTGSLRDFPRCADLREQGFADTVANQWAGTLAPAGTAPAVIAKLSAAFNAALSDADVRRRLAQAGVTPSRSSPEEFARYLKEEMARWVKLVRDKGIKGE